jgi:Kef-type K+ transport system membrane component KefB
VSFCYWWLDWKSILQSLRQQRRVVALTSLIGIAVPFTFGLLLGFNLPDAYLINPAQRLLFSLFMATALSISAIPIIAKIFMDLSLLRTGVGQAILGAAIVNDLVGWVFFAGILSMLTTSVESHGSVTVTVLLTITFAMACLTFRRRLMAKLFGFFKDLNLPPEGFLG